MAALASLLQMLEAQGLLNVIFPHQLSIPPLNLDSECLYECFRSYFTECFFSELSFQVLVSGFKIPRAQRNAHYSSPRGSDDFLRVMIRFTCSPHKALLYCDDPHPAPFPRHWQLIGSQFSTASPSFSVDDN